MKNQSSKSNISYFISNNWFKIVLIVAGVYIVFQKDMSFTINLNAPIQEELDEEKRKKTPQVKTKEEKEQYTIDAKQMAAKSGKLETFEIPFWGNSKSSASPYQVLLTVNEETQLSYLKRFAHVAISERKKFGVPSSIILANALLYSQAGQGAVTQSNNNHFSLKEENGAYRRYDNAWSSFRDYSVFITNGDFEQLRDLKSTDYRSWAKALEKGHFNNNESLNEDLIKIIEKYQLYDLDLK